MTFSERMGIEPKAVLQVDSMDQALRNALWNCVADYLSAPATYAANHPVSRVLWTGFLKQAVDDMPDFSRAIARNVKSVLDNAAWNRTYDFIEFILPHLAGQFERLGAEGAFSEIIADLQQGLEREHAGYRLAVGRFVPVTTEAELAAVERALSDLADHTARAHLQMAIELLALRPQPDLRNSIKESISAVESLSKAMAGTPKAELGAALKVLEQKHGLHGALKNGFSALYGYTSDANGIRHALMDEPNLQQEDAVYMLVSCSAFVSYLVAKAVRLGIPLRNAVAA